MTSTETRPEVHVEKPDADDLQQEGAHMSAAEPGAGRVLVRIPTDGDMRMALLGVKGIFTALQLIENGELRGVDEEGAIEDARGCLITAGKVLATMICDSF